MRITVNQTIADGNLIDTGLAGILKDEYKNYLSEKYPDADCTVKIDIQYRTTGGGNVINVWVKGETEEEEKNLDGTEDGDIEEDLNVIYRDVCENRGDEWIVE